jgi:hypothetical protein
MSKKISSRCSERGQSLSEFSMVLMFILILLAGVADLGRAFFTYISLRDAAQEGALYGSFAFSETTLGGGSGSLVSPATACSRIATRLVQNSDSPVDLSTDATVSIQITQASNPGVWVDCSSTIPIQPCVNDRIRVSVIYQDFPITMPFLGTLIGRQSVDITARVEDSILAPAGSQTNACP